MDYSLQDMFCASEISSMNFVQHGLMGGLCNRHLIYVVQQRFAIIIPGEEFLIGWIHAFRLKASSR